MNGLLAVARLTLYEAFRKRILVAALIAGAGFLTLYGIGLHFMGPANEDKLSLVERRVIFNMMTLAGLFAANFLTIMTAVLLPVDTLSGEIASGVIQTVAVRPIRRRDIVLGKWLGHWIVMAAYFALLAGGVLTITALSTGFTPAKIEIGLPLILLEGTVLLTLSIAGGAKLSTVTNGMLGFGLFGLAFIGNLVEQIGTMAGSEAARQVGTVASLIMPSEALWQLAAYHMQPSVIRDLGNSPFSPVSVPSTAMVVWAAGYIVVTLALGVRWFGKRAL
ncbi:MAG TPA: ABC transporter permease [Candidatus Eisenbacteria bacterium]|jgi:ABC-type transport system involved in multi-copper enzyme maturation permease subunit|nr:ABC transporter permease [Candidatus Eisenbacteria bacterium]